MQDFVERLLCFYFGGFVVLLCCFATGVLEGSVPLRRAVLLQAAFVLFLWPVAIPLWLAHSFDLKGKK